MQEKARKRKFNSEITSRKEGMERGREEEEEKVKMGKIEKEKQR